MEGMKQIVAAYCERSNDSVIESAEAFFQQLDTDGDKKVSLAELKKSLPSWISNEGIFKQLDENSDTTLDFQEVLPVYYMMNKTDLTLCTGCSTLLLGPYFSCRLCATMHGANFSLCCGCYRNDSVDHEHPNSCLVDSYSLLAELRTRAADAQKSQDKRDMEELQEIAKAHYRAASPEVQGLAYKFFLSMDTNGDGKVELSEFLEFMRHEDYFHMETPQLFTQLDQDGNGTLEFYEVMTLYYIIRSGLPFCNSCRNFIPGMFFSCVNCFMAYPKTAFNLCRGCYQSSKYDHNCNQFLDNYMLLEVARKSHVTNDSSEGSSVQSTAVPATPVQQNNNVPNYNTYAAPPPPPPPPRRTPKPSMKHSNANPFATRRSQKLDNCKAALEALETATNIGTSIATFVGCTIQ